MNIKEDKKLNKLMVVFGVTILLVGVIILLVGPSNSTSHRISNLCTALGVGSICGGLGGWYGIKRLEKDPNKLKHIEVERKDERNKFIRYKAKARAGEISNWMVLLIAYACIVMDCSLWIIYSLIGVFILKYVFQIILSNHYFKKF